MAAARAEHDAPAGPDPDAVDTLERIVETSFDRRLSDEDELWLRCAIQAAIIGGDEWAVAFGVKGATGRGDGISQVRRRIGERALREAAEVLARDECATGKARAIIAALGRLEAGETSDDPHLSLLLRRAVSLGNIPRTVRRLAPLLQHGHETSLSRPDFLTAGKGAATIETVERKTRTT